MPTGQSLIAPLDLDAIVARLRTRGPDLSAALVFGLGAGIYFEYYRRADSPTRFFTGHNRRLEEQLDVHLTRFLAGDRRGAVVAALRANALAMNVDRSPVAGVMGMELFAEELENWAALPDWPSCVREAARTITNTGSLYRRRYARFLGAASGWLEPLKRFVIIMDELASEWDGLAVQLQATNVPNPEARFTRAGNLFQRLAAREEHFWGEIIELTNSE